MEYVPLGQPGGNMNMTTSSRRPGRSHATSALLTLGALVGGLGCVKGSEKADVLPEYFQQRYGGGESEKLARQVAGSYALVVPADAKRWLASLESEEVKSALGRQRVGVGPFRHIFPTEKEGTYGSGIDYSRQAIEGLESMRLFAAVGMASATGMSDEDYTVDLKLVRQSGRVDCQVVIQDDKGVAFAGLVPLVYRCPERRSAQAMRAATGGTVVKTELPTVYIVGSSPERYADQSAFARRIGQFAAWKITELKAPKDAGLAGRTLEFPSIRSALHSLPPGSKIRLGPGTYREPVVLDRPVEIVGEGQSGSAIIECPGGNAVSMRTPTATLRNLTVRNRRRNEKDASAAIWVFMGRLLLDGCDISSDADCGAGAKGSATELVLKRCRVHDCRSSGVFYAGNAKGTVEDCTIQGNRLSGIAIRDGSDPRVLSSDISRNGQYGVKAWRGAKGRIEGCTLNGNRRGRTSIAPGCATKVVGGAR
jgi:parallel beta-helix repeat protein